MADKPREASAAAAAQGWPGHADNLATRGNQAAYPPAPGTGSGPAIYVATSGRDRSSGRSLDSPVRTLARAVRLARPGSVINVRGGSYEGFIVEDGNFGTARQWIVLRAYDNEPVSVRSQGSGPTIYFYARSCDESRNRKSGDCAHAYWRIEGIEVQGSRFGRSDGNVIKIDTPDVQIVGNRLCCARADIIKIVRTADDVLIAGNEIWQDRRIVRPGGNAQGVDIVGADRTLVSGNYLHDLTDIAMYAKGNARETIFERNLLVRAGLGGQGNAIMCGQSTDEPLLVDGRYESYDCLVRNNVIAHVTGACLAAGSSHNARFHNNTCYETGTRVHAALLVTNESEVGQENDGVEFRGNVIYAVTNPRVIVDSRREAMADWSTLTLANNLYFAASGKPRFTLRALGIGRHDGVTFRNWQSALEDETGRKDDSRVADPEFADHELFRLRPESPALDAMDCATSADYAGTPRPQGSRCDIGAHELAR